MRLSACNAEQMLIFALTRCNLKRGGAHSQLLPLRCSRVISQDIFISQILNRAVDPRTEGPLSLRPGPHTGDVDINHVIVLKQRLHAEEKNIIFAYAGSI